MGRNLLSSKKLSGGLGTPRIEIKLLGDWEKTIRILQNLSPKIKKSSVQAQLKVCRLIQKKVKAHIRNQDLGWKALNPSYAERKERLGLSFKTLMAYGTYYNSIDVWRKNGQPIVFVGVKKGIYTQTLSGKKSKIEVAVIAAIHEFASGGKIPKRALWNPTIQEMGGAKGIKRLYVNSLMYWLRINGVPVKRIQNIL